MAQALTNRRWVADIEGALMCKLFSNIFKYGIWLITLSYKVIDMPDQHKWRLTKSGSYTSKSAYDAYFLGSIEFAPWKLFLWLAVKNRCWTADWLSRGGLLHPADCPLCDQEEEIQHIL